MTETTTSPPRARRTFLRSWVPFAVLAVAGLLLCAIWFWPSEDFEPAMRSIATILVSLISLLLVTIWLLFFSRLRGWQGLAILLVTAAVVVGAVRDVKLTGDWVPLPVFRWDSRAVETTAPDQRSSERAGNSGGVDMTRISATDFPEYRGKNRDGIVHGPALARDWTVQPPRLLWRRSAGGGYSSIAVVGNAAVTLEQRGQEEAVVCYDAATGEERWIYAYPALFSEWQGGSGPRATPTIVDGDVYALGGTGQLVCLEGNTGHKKWSVNTLEGNDNVRWGISGSPLVFRGVVIVNAGVQTASARGSALVAYDCKTGRRVWGVGNTRAGYSSPMLATLAGRLQILLFDGEEFAGYDVNGAEKLWAYPWKTMEGINAAQPLVLDGDRVLVSSGYGVGSAVLHITEADLQYSVKPLWGEVPNKRLQCKFSSPVARDGFVYGLDNGTLVCLDQKDGSRKWRGGRYGHGQLLLADDLLVILSEAGELVLVEASPEAPRELGKIAALNAKTRTWNYPALADGKVYVRNDLEMACFDLHAPK